MKTYILYALALICLQSVKAQYERQPTPPSHYVVKPGKCPLTLKTGSAWSCYECKHDGGCQGQEKCCSDSSGYQKCCTGDLDDIPCEDPDTGDKGHCVLPRFCNRPYVPRPDVSCPAPYDRDSVCCLDKEKIPPKPGKCPKVSNMCYDCKNDQECSGTDKCCQGCCVGPVKCQDLKRRIYGLCVEPYQCKPPQLPYESVYCPLVDKKKCVCCALRPEPTKPPRPTLAPPPIKPGICPGEFEKCVTHKVCYDDGDCSHNHKCCDRCCKKPIACDDAHGKIWGLCVGEYKCTPPFKQHYNVKCPTIHGKRSVCCGITPAPITRVPPEACHGNMPYGKVWGKCVQPFDCKPPMTKYSKIPCYRHTNFVCCGPPPPPTPRPPPPPPAEKCHGYGNIWGTCVDPYQCKSPMLPYPKIRCPKGYGGKLVCCARPPPPPTTTTRPPPPQECHGTHGHAKIWGTCLDYCRAPLQQYPSIHCPNSYGKRTVCCARPPPATPRPTPPPPPRDCHGTDGYNNKIWGKCLDYCTGHLQEYPNIPCGYGKKCCAKRPKPTRPPKTPRPSMKCHAYGGVWGKCVEPHSCRFPKQQYTPQRPCPYNRYGKQTVCCAKPPKTTKPPKQTCHDTHRKIWGKCVVPSKCRLTQYSDTQCGYGFVCCARRPRTPRPPRTPYPQPPHHQPTPYPRPQPPQPYPQPAPYPQPQHHQPTPYPRPQPPQPYPPKPYPQPYPQPAPRPYP